MLLLEAAYGHDTYDGVWISLRAAGSLRDAEVKDCLKGFGCPDSFADKAVGLLHSSGRYDCVVQSSWVSRGGIDTFREHTDRVNVSVVTDSEYRHPYGWTKRMD